MVSAKCMISDASCEPRLLPSWWWLLYICLQYEVCEGQVANAKLTCCTLSGELNIA